MGRLAITLGLLAALATPATGQLRTLCSSPTMDYCASFLTLEYQLGAFGNGVPQPQLQSTVDVFGPGLAQGEQWGISAVFAWYEWSPGMIWGMGIFGTAEGEGVYDLSDTAFWNEQVGPAPTFGPSIADLTRVTFNEFGTGPERTTVGCTPGVTCHEVSVPEPASALLLATGLLGLAYARRRRA